MFVCPSGPYRLPDDSSRRYLYRTVVGRCLTVTETESRRSPSVSLRSFRDTFLLLPPSNATTVLLPLFLLETRPAATASTFPCLPATPGARTSEYLVHGPAPPHFLPLFSSTRRLSPSTHQTLPLSKNLRLVLTPHLYPPPFPSFLLPPPVLDSVGP